MVHMHTTANTATSLDITTLVVAIVGAATGLSSLVWSYIAHRDSGVKIAVDLEPGFAGSGGYYSVKPSRAQQPAAAVGIPTGLMPVFAVTVRNVGRLPAKVRRISLHTDGLSFQRFDMPYSPQLPQIIDVSDSSTWFYEVADASALVHAASVIKNSREQVFVEVALGSGTTKRSKKLVLSTALNAVGSLQVQPHTAE